jgi:hypothetical protein
MLARIHGGTSYRSVVTGQFAKTTIESNKAECPMQAVATRNSPSPKVLVFRTRMSAQAPLPPSEPEQQPNWHDPQRHGNFSQIITAIIASVALLVAAGGFIFNVWSRHSDKEGQSTDEHTSVLISKQLDPAIDKVNGHIDNKVDPLSHKIDDLSDRVSRIEGSMGKRLSHLENRVDQHEALARIQEDPDEILGTIRDEIRLAQETKEEIPYLKLADFKLAIHALAPSAEDYWKTAAEIINYQSLLDQLHGQAPDPRAISGPCLGVTTSGTMMSDHNTYRGAIIQNCIIDLDTNTFISTEFKNSVVRYHGGTTTLANVRFTNCRFILDLPRLALPERNLLFAILDAPNQTRVTIR